MTRKINCMNCMVGRFKDDLCDEKMCEALKRVGNSDDFVDIIMLAKDIVRCKDCCHYEKFNYEAPSGYDGWCNIPVIYTDGHYTSALHFCSYGERREL